MLCEHNTAGKVRVLRQARTLGSRKHRGANHTLELLSVAMQTNTSTLLT
jgi:hypothetical protein